MKLNKFMQSYADEIKGNFSEYDDQRSVIVVPLTMERLQAVVGEENTDDKQINISSKVCMADNKIDYKKLLEENNSTKYGKFCIANDFLKVSASIGVDHANEHMVKEMIQEVAQLADKWEFNITGKDIF